MLSSPILKIGCACLAVSVICTDALADSTLVYGEQTGADQTVVPTHQIHVSEGKVSIAVAGTKRLLIFDSESDSATLVDHGKKEVTAIDQGALVRLAVSAVEIQQKVLAEMESKLAGLPKDERQAMRKIMDTLHQLSEPGKVEAPEDLDYRPTGRAESFMSSEVEKAEILEGEKNWGDALLIEMTRLGMPQDDASALSAFGRFFEGLVSEVPGVWHRLFGSPRLLAPDGRLIVRLERRKDEKTGEGGKVELLRFDTESVDSEWFQVPADFQRMSLSPIPGVPGGGDSGASGEVESSTNGG